MLGLLAAGFVAWSVRSAAGSAWLLGLVPQLRVVAPKGALIGDFSAERIDIVLAGSGTLRIDAPRWQGLSAWRGGSGRWLHITIATLHADRVVWTDDAAKTPSTEPNRPPGSLRLPVEIEIGEATVDELRIGGDSGFAVRALRSGVHLGADGGARHRLTKVAARIDRGAAEGALTIATDAPFALEARVEASSGAASAPAGLPWQASVVATGPLAAMNVTGTARVPADKTHAQQSLDARALVRPFAAWPLGELQARLDGLDLSAFSSAAPATALSGRAIATTQGLAVPALVSVDLRNARAGRWNEGLLPVTRLLADVQARPDTPDSIDVRSLAADLGSAALPGGRVAAQGRWAAGQWNLEAQFAKVRPIALDARAPDTALDGKATLTGSGFAAAAAAKPGATDARTVDLVAALTGTLVDRRLPRDAPKTAQLRLEAKASANAVEIRAAEARLGGASARLAGRLARPNDAAPWQARGDFALVAFDPAPWWPGEPGSLLSRGTNRIDGKGEFDIAVPAKLPATDSLFATASALRGKLNVAIADSQLAGVPVRGEASFANSDGSPLTSLDAMAGGNRLRADGRIAAAGSSRDDWQLNLEAPQLAALSPWLGPKWTATPRLAGTLTATAHVAGRWPDVSSDGELLAAGVRFGDVAVRRATARWRGGSADGAAVEANATVDGVVVAGRAIEEAKASVTGTAKAHRAELRIVSAALPPQWADVMAAAAAPSTTPPPTSPALPGARSIVTLSAEGGLVDAAGERLAGWRGSLREALAQSTATPQRTWLRAQDVRGAVFWSGGPLRADVDAGSAQALGATLRWSRIAWQQGEAGQPARLDAQASVDAFPVVRALQALQPAFGWGGDLAVSARIDVRSAPTTHIAAAIERTGGDLTVTDEVQTQRLGLSELRLALAADAGVWRFTGTAAGSTLGIATATVTARASPTAAWLEPASPIDGQVELRVANLGTWGNWVPAGWRLGGTLLASAAVGGRFGAPQYTGRVEGTGLSVRNFVEGVNIADGSVAIALQGTTAHIERFTAKGGAGTVRLEGDAEFDAAPTARLKLVAERFEMLGRVDRRIVTSGSAALRLDAKAVALDGAFTVDEGLVDFTRSDAPALGSDVIVVRRPAATAATAAAAAAAASAPPGTVPMPVAAAAAASAPANPLAPARAVALDLRVGMGEKLRVRGRGLDAGLRGELRITSPGGRLAVAGTLSTVDGTYQAYGQKLGIDRGVLVFAGPVENPRLDIEATRPNLDVRVGVTVGGTALAPRVRLFSEPELSELDKLSWLVLGRASASTGGADAALLQQAALALLSGEGPGVTDRLIQSIGLDEVSVRQSQGAVKDTIVSLGKQISKRWYVGYERGLNTTTGTWQLIYRVAQRVTVRAEAGGDNAIDVNWTLRWK